MTCPQKPFLVAILILMPLMHAVSFAQLAERPSERIVFSSDDTQRCFKCHGMANFAFRDSMTLEVHNFSVNSDIFKASVHGKVPCQQCHIEIKEYPHTFERSRPKVSCGNECHAIDSTGKAYTHSLVVTEFQHSVHRKALTGENPDSPTCLTCHGQGNPHAVGRVKKTITIKEKMSLCVSCHENATLMVKSKVDPEAVSSYKRSFHYKAIRFGQNNTAVCQDCHTVHHILPKDSTGSSIAIENISKTCGRETCHPGARMNFSMSGANHLALRIEREPLLFLEEKFFIFLTLGTMAMLGVGIVLDIQRTFGWIHLLGQGASWVNATTGSLRGTLGRLLRLSKKILID